VLPSHAYETLGKTILESYAQARGVVATDLGSRREFVKHGETGLLYGVGNIEQLSASLRILLDHPDWAAKMGYRDGSSYVRSTHRQLTIKFSAACMRSWQINTRLQGTLRISSRDRMQRCGLDSALHLSVAAASSGDTAASILMRKSADG